MSRKPRAYPAPPPWMKVGVLVDYSAVLGEPPTLRGVKVRSEPWQLGHGQWVVSIEGKAGGVAVEALREAGEATAENVTDEDVRALLRPDPRLVGDTTRTACFVVLGSGLHTPLDVLMDAKRTCAAAINARRGGR